MSSFFFFCRCSSIAFWLICQPFCVVLLVKHRNDETPVLLCSYYVAELTVCKLHCLNVGPLVNVLTDYAFVFNDHVFVFYWHNLSSICTYTAELYVLLYFSFQTQTQCLISSGYLIAVHYLVHTPDCPFTTVRGSAIFCWPCQCCYQGSSYSLNPDVWSASSSQTSIHTCTMPCIICDNVSDQKHRTSFIVEPCIDTISINSNQLMHISVFIKNTLKVYLKFLLPQHVLDHTGIHPQGAIIRS